MYYYHNICDLYKKLKMPSTEISTQTDSTLSAEQKFLHLLDRYFLDIEDLKKQIQQKNQETKQRLATFVEESQTYDMDKVKWQANINMNLVIGARFTIRKDIVFFLHSKIDTILIYLPFLFINVQIIDKIEKFKKNSLVLNSELPVLPALVTYTDSSDSSSLEESITKQLDRLNLFHEQYLQPEKTLQQATAVNTRKRSYGEMADDNDVEYRPDTEEKLDKPKKLSDIKKEELHNKLIQQSMYT